MPLLSPSAAGSGSVGDHGSELWSLARHGRRHLDIETGSFPLQALFGATAGRSVLRTRVLGLAPRAEGMHPRGGSAQTIQELTAGQWAVCASRGSTVEISPAHRKWCPRGGRIVLRA